MTLCWASPVSKVSKSIFLGAAYQKLQSAEFMLPWKGEPLAVVWTVCRWCRYCAAGPEGSCTGEVQRLQKICHHYCWVFATLRKSEC